MYIFKKGHIGTMFFIIKQGKVQIQSQQKSIQNDRFYKQIKNITLQKGHSFGQLALIYKTFRTASVKAIQNCKFLCLPIDKFQQTLQQITRKNIQSNKILIDKYITFCNLSHKQKQRLANHFVKLNFSQNQIILSQQQQSVAFYIIVSGKVVIDIPGRQQLQLKTGNYFGQSGLMQNEKIQGNIYCIQKTEIISISHKSLQSILQKNQIKYIYFLSKISNVLKRNFIFKNIKIKILYKIVKISQICQANEGQQISKKDCLIQQIFIPLKGEINGFQIEQIINSQHLVKLQTQNSYKPVQSFSLIINQKGYCCVIDIKKLFTLFVKYNIILKNFIKNQKDYIQSIKSIKSFKSLNIINFDSLQKIKDNLKSNKSIKSIKSIKYIDSQRYIIQKYNKQQIKIQNLDFIKKIGQGQFGGLYKVRNQLNNKFYAIKIINKSLVDQLNMAKFIKQQIQAMSQIKFDSFIVKYEKYFKTYDYVLILMQYIQGKNFFSILKQLKTIKTNFIKFLFASFVLSIQYLHQKNIIYRDIRPQNGIIDKNGYIKLIDLGTAKKLTKNSHKSFTIIGTPHYMAPEIVQGLGYGLQVDLWSLGILLYQISYMRFPFAQQIQDPIQIFDQLLKFSTVQFPKQIQNQDQSLKQLIKRLIVRNPMMRQNYMFNKIKNSKFYQNFQWQQFIQKRMKCPFNNWDNEIQNNNVQQQKVIEQTFKNYLVNTIDPVCKSKKDLFQQKENIWQSF